MYRVQAFGPGKVRILDDTRPPAESDILTLERFNERVLGIVVCDLKVRDADRLQQAWAAAL